MNRNQSRRTTAILAWVLAWISIHSPISAAEAPVVASLKIPAAETYVIGDDIPLLWEFVNQGAEPLAFLWEGCCRLNGRLRVTLENQPLAPIPPGAAIAHRFARAERLDPGRPGEFPTLLTDWVRLSRTGRYRLQGRYIGVLPDQRPQVPGALALWRDEAVTSTIEVDLLHPDTYLAQRAEREHRRQLAISLEGPDRFPTLNPATFHVTFRNLANTPQSLFWPGPAQLWLINDHGERVGVRTVRATTEKLELPAGASLSRSFTLSADALLDAPFAQYRVFVDYPADDAGRPRFPSQAVAISWKLDKADVLELIQKASSGAATGLRNAPLKRLRVYLSEIRPVLESISSTDFPAQAGTLVRELQLASCLKAFAPHPGAVDLGVRVDSQGEWQLEDASLRACCISKTLPRSSPSTSSPNSLAQLTGLLEVRRHLGWTIRILVRPDLDTTVDHLMELASSWVPLRQGLAGPPKMQVTLPGASVTNEVSLQAAPLPANVVLRLQRQGSVIRPGLACRFPDPKQPQLTSLFSIEELKTLDFPETLNTASGRDQLRDERLNSPQILVLADPDLSWKECLDALQPLWELGWSADLALRP